MIDEPHNDITIQLIPKITANIQLCNCYQNLTQNLQMISNIQLSDKNDLKHTNIQFLQKMTSNIQVKKILASREGEAEERSRWEGAGGR